MGGFQGWEIQGLRIALKDFEDEQDISNPSQKKLNPKPMLDNVQKWHMGTSPNYGCHLGPPENVGSSHNWGPILAPKYYVPQYNQ